MLGQVTTAVALDTDIGSDVDDLLALATLLGSPELDLAAVTTVYGDTLLRARMVLRCLRLAGVRRPPPVAAGLPRPRSGREAWWAGHEGRLLPDLDAEPVDPTLDAPGLLASHRRVLAIGPLTNRAAALERPDSAVRELWLMGGDFATEPDVEHNFGSDADAAAVLFSSGLPCTVIGLDQTRRVTLDDSWLSGLAGRGELADLVVAEVRQYWSHLGRPTNTPHDPIAVLTLARPDLFTFARGEVRIAADGRAGFTPSETGRHRVVTDLDELAVRGEIVRRLAAASG